MDKLSLRINNKPAGYSQMKPKLAILQFHPAPYRDAIFKKVCERSIIDITVFTMSEVDSGHTYRPRYALGYPNHFLGPSVCYKYLRVIHPGIFFHPGIFTELSRGNYDAYLTHMGSITGIIVMLYSWIKSKSLILSGDGVVFPKINKVRFGELHHWIIRQVLKNAATVWVPGNATQEFHEYYGLPKERIFQGAYCLDIDHILQLSESAQAKRQDIRAQIGVEDSDWLFLFVGRMLSFRGVKYLLEAFYFLKRRFENVKLLLIGDGSERPGLQAECQRLGLSGIIFLDSVPMDQLTDYYVAADAYVTAALRENYSLALAQAAICGLPMISTDRVGATKDYLLDEETGLIVPAGDSHALAAAMARLVTSRDLADDMGRKAAALSKRRTITWAAEQLEAAVFQALEISRSQTSRL